MEKLCCVRLWLQFCAEMCCWPITLGMWLHRKGCCTGMANCCLACRNFVPDIEAKEKRAALLNREYNGCDSTYLPTMCGTIKLPEGDAKAAAEWRLPTMVSKWLPCVPESWRDVTKSKHWIKGRQGVKEASRRVKKYRRKVKRGANRRFSTSSGGENRRDRDIEEGKSGYHSQSSGVVDSWEEKRGSRMGKDRDQ